MTFRTRQRARSAFTLIELIAVIVVLAILSGVALPRYFDYADKAKEAALHGSLGGVRAGIANFYADQAIDGNAQYPTATELGTQGTVMQEDLPDNPYNGLNTIKTVTSLTDAQNRVADGTTGWCFYVNNASDPPVYYFWANSDDTTASGTTANDE
jgi:prepilin-type N-terminal cleavage/methylation domain-containing protein